MGVYKLKQDILYKGLREGGGASHAGVCGKHPRQSQKMRYAHEAGLAIIQSAQDEHPAKSP